MNKKLKIVKFSQASSDIQVKPPGIQYNISKQLKYYTKSELRQILNIEQDIYSLFDFSFMI